MRPVILCSLLVVICIVTFSRDEHSPISVSIAIPECGGKRLVNYRDPSSHFNVIISNNSNKPQRLWREWCSWGYYALTFEIANEAGKKMSAKKLSTCFTRNWPDTVTLAPGKSVTIEVYFSDTEKWQGFPLSETGPKSVTMQAIYECKRDEEAQRYNVWTGRVVSQAFVYTFVKQKSERQ